MVADEVRPGETQRLTLDCRGDWSTLFYEVRSQPDSRDVRETLAAQYVAAGPALDDASAALRAFGPRCELLVEWAAVVLHNAMVKGDGGSADSEAAVRILLTGVEDLNVQPVELELQGPTGVYELLAQHFCAARDLASCATALDFAIARLSRVPAPQAGEIDRWRARLEEHRHSVLPPKGP